MSNLFRRYELLLPRQFNDEQLVPDELVADTLLELRRRFGAVSSETQIIRGLWEHQGQSYRDELIRVFVDVLDTAETQQFFREYKEHLKARFRQIDIWMTSHPIDVI
jgi:dimeric dUTPase (all-alpha-NTP-PPase superfamily)